MDERERRIGLNEATFREINERIEDLAATFEVGERLDLICECGNASCASRIEMSHEDYESSGRTQRHLRSSADTRSSTSKRSSSDTRRMRSYAKRPAAHRKWLKQPIRAERTTH